MSDQPRPKPGDRVMVRSTKGSVLGVVVRAHHDIYTVSVGADSPLLSCPAEIIERIEAPEGSTSTKVYAFDEREPESEGAEYLTAREVEMRYGPLSDQARSVAGNKAAGAVVNRHGGFMRLVYSDQPIIIIHADGRQDVERKHGGAE